MKYIDVVITKDPSAIDGSTDFTGKSVPVDVELIERIIQDEIYAQVGWPRGRLSMSAILKLADLIERENELNLRHTMPESPHEHLVEVKL